jgi:hypothetical protein
MISRVPAVMRTDLLKEDLPKPNTPMARRRPPVTADMSLCFSEIFTTGLTTLFKSVYFITRFL